MKSLERCGLLFGLLLGTFFSLVANSADREQIMAGEYLSNTASCKLCHTRPGGQPFAGGRELETPYGRFFTPNITPDLEKGIGSWSDQDFMKALRHGVAPRDGIASKGAYYFPIFPYTSYTQMKDEDILAIKAYIFNSVKPSNEPNKDHEIKFPYNIRMNLKIWRDMFFRPGAREHGDTRVVSESFQRGGYLVNAVAHCVECHTPRTPVTNGLKLGKALSGNPNTPEGVAPNITMDATGIGNWSREDFVTFLEDGTKPNSGSAEGMMEKIINEGTSQLTDEDREAIVEYILAQRPIKNEVKKRTDNRPY